MRKAGFDKLQGILYDVFYLAATNTLSLLYREMINLQKVPGTDFTNWIGALRGNMQYRACVSKAAVNWKIVLAGALAGLDE